ncbi:MAG: flippase-like domain-containing protein [Eubacterium sp.]
MVHKVSVALFSGLLFVLNWKVMSCNYREYGVYLGLAYLLTAIISIALIIFAVSAKSHKLILAIVRHFNKSGRLTPALTKLEQSCDIMEKSTSKLLKDVPSLISMVLKNMAKLCFWYCVPFLILFGSNEISLLDSLSITSLSVMTAAVIPTPAGIGAVELIMTNLFAVLVGVHKAGAITVLYRVATFIFPFVVGGVLILISKVVHRHK